MARKELLEKIAEIREGLGELEELAGKETEGKAERSVFFLALEDAAKLLRAGFAGIFQIGDIIVSRHAEADRIAWTVIGKNVDKDPEYPEQPTLTLLMRDVLPGFWRYSKPTAKYQWGHAHWQGSTIREKLNGDFLSGFTAEDQDAMIAVDKVTYTVDAEGGKPETTRDKLFLLSCTEAGFKPGTYIWDEGPAYPYFTGSESRMKVDEDGDARYWWLRSPYPGYAYSVRYVDPDGSLDYSGAYDGYGAAAACVIG